MAEAIERLDLGGSYGAPFRKMLVDFAYYRLERSMSRSDFDTAEDKNGRLLLKDKAADVCARATARPATSCDTVVAYAAVTVH